MIAHRTTRLSLAALAALAATNSLVQAAGVNTDKTPMAGQQWSVPEVGWLYTPTSSLSLSGVQTMFSATGTARTITVEVYSGLPSSGGTLLRSGMFSSAYNTLIGGTFPELSLAAGNPYFIGFRNIQSFGTNTTNDAGATSLGNFWLAATNSGTYNINGGSSGFVTQPILKFISTGGSWTSSAGGDWSDGNKWSGGAEPSANSDATFNLNSTYTISLASPANARDINITTGDVTIAAGMQTLQTSRNLNISGGSLTTGGMIRAGSASAGQIGVSGNINVTGGALKAGSLTLAAAGNLNFTNGTLSISGGTYTQPTGALVVSGLATSDNPLLHFSAGAINSLNNVQGIVVGGATANTYGQLLIEGSSVLANTGGGSVSVGTYGGTGVLSGDGLLGLNSGSFGTATVTGSGSKWTNSQSLYVGYLGSGTLNVQAGGLVSNSTGYLGYDSGSSSTATVTGNGSKWTNTSLLNVGVFGTGTLNVEEGGEVSNINGYIGLVPGATGTAIVTGGGSKWTTTQSLLVGYSGNGTLRIQAGGEASNTLGSIGFNSSSTSSTATVTGSGSKWSNVTELSVGYFGTGTLNVEAGGEVSDSLGYIGRATGSSGTVTVTGNSSKWTNTSSLKVGLNGTGVLNIESGGTVEVFGNTSINSMPNSRINLKPGGTLTTITLALDGLASRLNWTGGTLHLTGGSSNVGSLTIPSSGTLSGTGSVTGTVVVNGLYSPGNSPGLMTINGNLDFNANSDFSVDVWGPAAGTGFDQVTVNGTVDLTGADILANLNGYLPTMYQLFPIIINDGTDPVTGHFANAIDSGLGWDYFNVGSNYFQVYYNGGTGNDVVLVSVPEPASLGMLSLGALGLLARRRRTRRD